MGACGDVFSQPQSPKRVQGWFDVSFGLGNRSARANGVAPPSSPRSIQDLPAKANWPIEAFLVMPFKPDVINVSLCFDINRSLFARFTSYYEGGFNSSKAAVNLFAGE
jgi:hypothetical protein